jgi:hypothetical protein
MAIDNPIDAVESQYKESPDAPLDLVLLAAELALPHAAPLLKFVGLIRGHFSARERRERAQAFLDLLRDQQKILEVLGKNFDQLNVKVDDLAEAVQLGVIRDVEAFNDNKRDRYLNIIGNGVRSLEKIEDLASFIRDTELLGEQDIAVLITLDKVMNKDSDWGSPATGSLHPNIFIQRRRELAKQVALTLGMNGDFDSNDGRSFSHEEGYSVCARLQGFGLAHEIELSAREVPIGDYCFRPSKRGLMLLRLLGESVPNWDRYFPPEKKVP